jgi:hypothetical protein
VHYEIRVEGELSRRWSVWFDGLRLTSAPGGVTIIAGEVADQAALHGLLARIRDLGLPLISVRRTGPPRRGGGTRDGTWGGTGGDAGEGSPP